METITVYVDEEILQYLAWWSAGLCGVGLLGSILSFGLGFWLGKLQEARWLIKRGKIVIDGQPATALPPRLSVGGFTVTWQGCFRGVLVVVGLYIAFEVLERLF